MAQYRHASRCEECAQPQGASCSAEQLSTQHEQLCLEFQASTAKAVRQLYRSCLFKKCMAAVSGVLGPQKGFKIESKPHLLKVSCCNIASTAQEAEVQVAAQPLAAERTHTNKTGPNCPLAAVDSNNAKVRAAAQRKQRQRPEMT